MAADRAPGRAIPPTTRSAPQIGVLIVSELRLLGEGLAEALERGGAVTVRGLAADLQGALARILDCPPDIVLIDAALPDGRDAVRRIRDAAPQLPVVVLAAAETAENIIAWAEAGVAGYIPKTAALADVVPYLMDIMRGEQACLGSVAAGLLHRLSCLASAGSGRNDAPSAPALTPRERQIVQLISAGLSNKDIARRLNIGVATTKSHVHNLLGKLNLQRRSQAALWKRQRDGRPDAFAAPLSQGAAAPASNRHSA